MSDIGPTSAMEVLMVGILAVLIAGPPLVVGLVCLVLHFLLPGHGRRWTVLYFVASVVAETGVMVWTSFWMNDAMFFDGSVPIALAGSGIIFGIFLALRALIRRMRRRA
jgi:hypothetical protein